MIIEQIKKLAIKNNLSYEELEELSFWFNTLQSCVECNGDYLKELSLKMGL